MFAIAPILKQRQNEITFAVDDVEPAPKRLRTVTAKSKLEEELGKPLFAFSHDEGFETVNTKYKKRFAPRIHPLISAVDIAFSSHRPLVLTPDTIWLAIAQGFSHHINNNAEKYRDRFVSHSGKKKLEIKALKIPETTEEWSEAIHEWTLLIRDSVGAAPYHLLECNFSTTTPTTLTASRIFMMDVFREYFEFEMLVICGIPKITLLGTVEDWQRICDRVRIMAEYDLHWWTDRLLPICEEFVNTASGDPLLLFWQNIYKPRYLCGKDDLIRGWLADLFPYVIDKRTQGPTKKNDILNTVRFDFTVKNGIAAKDFPLGLCQVPFKVKVNYKKYRMKLVAGFIGVHQDSHDRLRPEIGWAVQEDDSFQQILDKIERKYRTEESIYGLPLNALRLLKKMMQN